MNKQSNGSKKSPGKNLDIRCDCGCRDRGGRSFGHKETQQQHDSNPYQTVQAEKGTLTATIGATGTVRSNQTAVLTWQNTGTVGIVKVKPGDQVKTGDVLASLLLPPVTQSTLESNLVTAQENLAELTSPEAIANAKLAITTAQTRCDQCSNSVEQHSSIGKMTPCIKIIMPSYVIAKDNLDKAQTAYDNAHVGQYINNANEANAYQTLYNAKQAYDTAHYYYSVYSQTPTQRQLDEAQANLDLANATLKNAQIYLAALTGGAVPADATGTALLQFEQAKLAVQTAQANLDADNAHRPVQWDGHRSQWDGGRSGVPRNDKRSALMTCRR